MQANQLITAPGDYNPLTSDFEIQRLQILKHKKLTNRSYWASSVAFTGTEKRFNDINCGLPIDQVSNKIPPPGAYDPKIDVFHPFMKTEGPFGSKANVSFSPLIFILFL